MARNRRGRAPLRKISPNANCSAGGAMRRTVPSEKPFDHACVQRPPVSTAGDIRSRFLNRLGIQKEASSSSRQDELSHCTEASKIPLMKFLLPLQNKHLGALPSLPSHLKPVLEASHLTSQLLFVLFPDTTPILSTREDRFGQMLWRRTRTQDATPLSLRQRILIGNMPRKRKTSYQQRTVNSCIPCTTHGSATCNEIFFLSWRHDSKHNSVTRF